MKRIYGGYKLYTAVVLVAITIGIAPLFMIFRLLPKMVEEERFKIETWARATEALASSQSDPATDLMLDIVASNSTIPVILTSQSNEIISFNNIALNAQTATDSLREVEGLLQKFRKEYPPIRIDLGSGTYQNLYYSKSSTLDQLLFFPHLQTWIFLGYVLIVVIVLMSIRRNEQNKLWVGLSKETAHQLGTPISSLMAWIELLDTPSGHQLIAQASPEMRKDIERLQLITERFSKIGSLPTSEEVDLKQLLMDSYDYLLRRISSQVDFRIELPESAVVVMASPALLSWVVENVVKNAVDATDGRGRVAIQLSTRGKNAYIDIADNGKGIPRSKLRTVFKPGYTTKSRGWGLGLSLAGRIVEEYHKGTIVVKASELHVGTTFRITLPLHLPTR